MNEEKNTADLQKIVQELQIVRGQIQTLSSQISEFSLTMESLESQSQKKQCINQLVIYYSK